MLDRRWIDGILWSCLLVMFLGVLTLLLDQAVGTPSQEWGPVARALVKP